MASKRFSPDRMGWGGIPLKPKPFGLGAVTLTNTPTLRIIQSPIISIVEAKKNDIESGLGQCAAQMLGAQRVNERDGTGSETIYGCITTGEAWQFMQLAETTLRIDSDRYYINDLRHILGVFQAIVDQYPHIVLAA